uniref:Bicarbonate transporter-like transmembrane domain-containing protein n=1 Tax=Monopterus albus TaxID=43700 RepID=A0A3Q3J0Y6_MONAL
TRQFVKPMNFQEEVRAHRDLDSFLDQASILLDKKAVTLDEVLRRMLTQMVEDGHGSCNVDEVMNSLFTDAVGKEFNTVHLLPEIIQGMTATSTGIRYQQSWLCILLQRRHVCVAHLEQPQNWGVNCCEAHYVNLILYPPRTKSTKMAIEIGRAFATMFSNISFRQKLLETETQEEFKQQLFNQRQQLSIVNQKVEDSDPCRGKPLKVEQRYWICFWTLHVTGCVCKYDILILIKNIMVCLTDILCGSSNLSDCSCVSLYFTVIRGICGDYDFDFNAFYACISLWNNLFLILGGLFNVSLLMKLFKCSTEEVIALFISMAFVEDAFKGIIKIFERFYHRPTLATTNTTLVLHQINEILEKTKIQMSDALRHHNDTSLVLSTRKRPILCLLLMLGTLCLECMPLFSHSLYLNDKIREVVSVCALPLSVVMLSFIGSYFFLDIQFPVFSIHDRPVFTFPPFEKLTGLNTLSVNIVISLTHVPKHKLLKGTAFYWDLMLTLAKVEQHVENGHLYTTIHDFSHCFYVSLFLCLSVLSLRSSLLPKVIDAKYLDIMDAQYM